MALCPMCYTEIGQWQDDPVRTPSGLAGSAYKGFTYVCSRHITELQDYWKQKEIDAGVSESQRTNFIPVSGNIRKSHIIQLRASVEKCLNASGQSKYDYFNFDADGNDMGTNKTQWTDPFLTAGRTYIKGIHIEDLRHPLVIELEWLETWEDSLTGIRMNVEGAVPTNPGWYDAPELIANPIIGVMADWEFYGQYRHGMLGVPMPTPDGHCWVKGEMLGTDNHYNMYTKTVKNIDSQWHVDAKSGVYIKTLSQGNKFELTENTKMSFDINNFVLNSDMVYPTWPNHGAGIMIEIKTVTVTSKPITYYVYSQYPSGSSDHSDHHYLHFGNRGIILSYSQFQNFDRNLWNDYITLWGEVPADGRWINYIKCEAVTSTYYYISTSESGFSIDNIKLYTET